MAEHHVCGADTHKTYRKESAGEHRLKAAQGIPPRSSLHIRGRYFLPEILMKSGTARQKSRKPPVQKAPATVRIKTRIPDYISEETRMLLLKITEAARKKAVRSGNLTRIKDAILKNDTGMNAYISVINALSDIGGESWTPCPDGSAVRFTKTYVTVRDGQGNLEHISWTPVYEALCEVIREGKWSAKGSRETDCKEQKDIRTKRREKTKKRGGRVT